MHLPTYTHTGPASHACLLWKGYVSPFKVSSETSWTGNKQLSWVITFQLKTFMSLGRIWTVDLPLSKQIGCQGWIHRNDAYFSSYGHAPPPPFQNGVFFLEGCVFRPAKACLCLCLHGLKHQKTLLNCQKYVFYHWTVRKAGVWARRFAIHWLRGDMATVLLREQLILLRSLR